MTRTQPGQGDLITAADVPPTDPAPRPAPGALHVPPRPAQTGHQETLFELAAPVEPASLPYLAADPAPLAAALTGDRYGWLAAVLPDPAPVWCTAHYTPMRLTGAARLVYACDRCDAERLDGGSAVAA